MIVNNAKSFLISGVSSEIIPASAIKGKKARSDFAMTPLATAPAK